MELFLHEYRLASFSCAFEVPPSFMTSCLFENVTTNTMFFFLADKFRQTKLNERKSLKIELIEGRSFTFMDQVNFVDPRWYKFRRFLRKYCPMRSISFYYIIMDQKRFFNRSQMFFSFFPKRKSATHTLPLPNTPSPLSSINYLLCTPYPPFHILTHFPVLLSQG